MTADSAQQVKLNVKLEALLISKDRDIQQLKADLASANAKIIALASAAQILKVHLLNSHTISNVLSLARESCMHSDCMVLASCLKLAFACTWMLWC